MLIIGISLVSCKKISIARETPKCIKEKVKEQKKNLCAQEGSAIKEYLFQDETVYHLNIDGGCIWGGNEYLFDSECGLIAQTETNLGYYKAIDTVRGEAFSNAEFVRVIWEK
jgi:hypothetical protein